MQYQDADGVDARLRVLEGKPPDVAQEHLPPSREQNDSVRENSMRSEGKAAAAQAVDSDDATTARPVSVRCWSAAFEPISCINQICQLSTAERAELPGGGVTRTATACSCSTCHV